VRILDEAIDIPRCDSEFITTFGDNSEIRTVQRLMRGCRLDKKNPNKRNSLFLWCDDLEVSKSVLTILKENDVNFHKKINIISNSYDKNDDEEIQKKIQEKKEIAEKFIKIDCLNLSQWWFMRFTDLKKFIDDNNKRPNKRSSNISEKKLGKWVQHQVTNYNNRTHGFQKEDMRKIWSEFISDQKYYKLFIDFESSWFKRYNDSIEYIKKHKQRPNKKNIDKEISRLGNWLVIQGKNYRKNNNVMKNPVIKKAWEDLINNPLYKFDFQLPEDQWACRLNEVKKIMDDNILKGNKQVRPTKNDPDVNIASLGIWLNQQSGKYNTGKIKNEKTRDQFKAFISDPKYRKYFLSDSEIWDEHLKEVKQFYDNLPSDKKKKPSKKSKDDYERSIGAWLYNQKQHYQKNQLNMKILPNNTVNEYRKKWENFCKETQ